MPDAQKLAPELVSLVHHIELNKAGWWDLAVQRLVLTAFWLKRGVVALSPSEVRATLVNEFSVTLDDALIQKQLQTLQDSGQVLLLPDGRLKVSEQTILSCEHDLAEAVELEVAVRRRFQALLAHHCPLVDHERAWASFSEKFLLPMVSELGANTYRLISGSGVEVDLPQLKSFTDGFDSSESVALHTFVRAFLDPSDSIIRRYVLRTMNAYFVVRASGLNEQTVERLARSTQQPSAVLFFDTNVLFSLLGLHENPADEGSLALLGLVQQISSSVPIKLRVLPPTLDEMKRAINASQEAVINMRISPKFLRLSASRGGSVVPADYFEPYLKNLLTILRGNGVDLFSQDLGGYKKKQDVVDDLLTQLEFEKQRFGERAKNYERLEHDMVLWHFVREKRPMRIESPLDAEYWIVTADYRFLAFDSHKQRTLRTEVPICLHPTTLTQMLQFWVPLTPQFEEALLSTMRLPTVFTLLDSDAERISLRILNALSTFENIGDLPKETATRILLNDALRQKLKVEQNVSRQVELIREALVEENRKVEQRAAEAKTRAQQLQQETEKLSNQLNCTTDEVQGLKSKLDRQQQEAAQNKAEAQQIKQKLATLIQEGARFRARTRFAIWHLGALATLVVAAMISVRLFEVKSPWISVGASALLTAWIWITHHRGQQDRDLQEWVAIKALSRFKALVYGTILAGALGSAAWDGIKWYWSQNAQDIKPTQVEQHQPK
jgi:hypothetical protein